MQGSGIRLFRFAGIQVYLHFSWFLVAAYQLTSRSHNYGSPIWALYEYVALFAMVLLHEFGHALACRQTGGYADRIILWPLGGIAYVQPPRRPGAMLWSIAAGPLVNVALVPLLEIFFRFAGHAGWYEDAPNAFQLIRTIRFMNFGLLIFNLLPIYPLDGGQIFRSLLWFPFGEIRSLQIASAVGLIGGAALAALAIYWQSLWTGVMAFFLFSRALAGWQQARLLTQEREAEPYEPVAHSAPDRST